MSETVFDLECRYQQLVEARDQGIAEIDYQGRRIKYSTMDTLNAAIRNLRYRIDQLRGTQGPPSVRGGTVYSRKGIY